MDPVVENLCAMVKKFPVVLGAKSNSSYRLLPFYKAFFGIPLYL
jgi:hypothetical protein